MINDSTHYQSPILSRDGKTRGALTGAAHRCRLEGCTGTRVTAKWPDGRWTYPCTKGLDFDDTTETWRII